MKNITIKKLVRFGKWLIPKHKDKNQILVVATTALGDTLWATPVLQNIKEQNPHSYLGVLTSPIGKEILKNNPYVDKLFVMEEPLSKHFFKLRKELYKHEFDTVLLLHASQRLTLPLVSLIGASRILGTAGINKGLDSLLTHKLPNHQQHEITRRLQIAEAIGINPAVETLSIFLTDQEFLPPRKGKWIAMHPGSKDSFKRWPIDNFIRLGKLIKENHHCEILITGTQSEREMMKKIAENIPGAHLDEPNRSLREFAALLNQMDLLISNDTGPVHLACALNRPVVAIYASTDPKVCGPHKAENATVVSRRAACDPCLKRKCRLPFCFMQISPEEVYDSLKSKL